MKNTLFAINDYTIRMHKPHRKWRWNYKQCWPVKVVRNVFGFAAVEEMKTQLIIILQNQEKFQECLNELINLESRMEVDENGQLFYNSGEENGRR